MKEAIEPHKSKIDGKGVFATRAIKKGELICIFKGNKVSIPVLKKKYESGEVRLDDPLQLTDNTYILLNKPYIYFNHSCSPNSLLKDAKLIAIRDIEKGQEITYDYSATEWSNSIAWGIKWVELWKFECRCKSKNCRHMITEFPLLPKKIKISYYKTGLLPKFIMEKYNCFDD